jgi:hypothetical protein
MLPGRQRTNRDLVDYDAVDTGILQESTWLLHEEGREGRAPARRVVSVSPDVDRESSFAWEESSGKSEGADPRRTTSATVAATTAGACSSLRREERSCLGSADPVLVRSGGLLGGDRHDSFHADQSCARRSLWMLLPAAQPKQLCVATRLLAGRHAWPGSSAVLFVLHRGRPLVAPHGGHRWQDARFLRAMAATQSKQLCSRGRAAAATARRPRVGSVMWLRQLGSSMAAGRYRRASARAVTHVCIEPWILRAKSPG